MNLRLIDEDFINEEIDRLHNSITLNRNLGLTSSNEVADRQCNERDTLQMIKRHLQSPDEKLTRAIELLQLFIDKVDSGRAKSFETYNLYKDFLNSIK